MDLPTSIASVFTSKKRFGGLTPLKLFHSTFLVFYVSSKISHSRVYFKPNWTSLIIIIDFFSCSKRTHLHILKSFDYTHTCTHTCTTSASKANPLPPHTCTHTNTFSTSKGSQLSGFFEAKVTRHLTYPHPKCPHTISVVKQLQLKKPAQCWYSLLTIKIIH